MFLKLKFASCRWNIVASCFFVFLIFYFWETDREREAHRGGAERETHRNWSRLQAPSCSRRAWHGVRSHKPWDHDLNQSLVLNRLSHPGAPASCFLNQSANLCLLVEVFSLFSFYLTVDIVIFISAICYLLSIFFLSFSLFFFCFDPHLLLPYLC